MYRIESVVLLFAFLPIIMAVVFRAAVVPRRKKNMVAAVVSAQQASTGAMGEIQEPPETAQYMHLGITRVARDFDSLYSTRLLVPAFILSFFYIVGLTLGISMFITALCPTIICRPITCVPIMFLVNPVSASVGAYVFNMGVIVRRSYMADITKNVFWASINRVVISVGMALMIYPLFQRQPVLCFAIAFFPKLFISLLRKQVTKVLAVTDTAVQELDIQLVQGIDVWKEERLEEEGIESVQNLATADVLGLAVKMHYPLRTIVDWMDQAILIQRFPKVFRAMQDAGFAVSAIEFAWMGLEGDPGLVTHLSQQTGLDPLVLKSAMRSMSEDAIVRILWRLWQGDSTE